MSSASRRVNATFILTQTLLPLLRESQDGSVVFTTSSVSNRGRAYWGAYAVSKFAVEGLMQVLADETDTTTAVRVNSGPRTCSADWASRNTSEIAIRRR